MTRPAPESLALKPDESPPATPYTVAVRELCQFAAKQGDLDLRFTPVPTAAEGIAGHQVVAQRRGAAYQKEVPVQGAYRELRLRGRADGFDANAGRVDEVKTHKGDLARVPANHRALHRAQARVYGWLLCEALGLAELQVAVVYFDIGNQQETPEVETLSAAELRAFGEGLCERFLAWAQTELAHRQARNTALQALAFPHGGFRQGQRALSENVYRAARLGRCLMAQAPTGIGKTVGTLFPLLKAMPDRTQGLDKVFFLSAKTPGRAVALEALATLQAHGAAPLRALELVARDKACEHPDKACHGDSCPLAQGFYDRLPAARAATVQATRAEGLLTREVVRSLALAHAVCPYYLSQELVRWVDVVVGDYNYFFDSSALLFALSEANGWQTALLVDEAHNLVDRARSMYSSSLEHDSLRAVRRSAPAALKRPLDRWHRAWNTTVKSQTAAYTVAPLPEAWVLALQEACGAMTEFYAANPIWVDPGLQTLYFDALGFMKLVDSFGDHALFDITLNLGTQRRLASTLSIRNVVPAPHLKARWAAARCAVLFSGTLAPQHFYADLLGLPDTTAWLDVAAPFDAAQLQVKRVTTVSTRYAHRTASVAPIVALMAAQFQAAPGNYLAFFSSFDYLAQVESAFAAAHPQVPRWAQTRGMGEAQRQAFLARFEEGGQGIAFAVLGGAFGEGVDLPGRKLIGAFIATLGLPQVNPLNEEMRERMQVLFGAGYDYTYLYPGLRKVAQAAGRVIRTVHDRGVVYLIDDRFQRPEVQRLLPAWWSMG